jgi:hypothetical protein
MVNRQWSFSFKDTSPGDPLHRMLRSSDEGIEVKRVTLTMISAEDIRSAVQALIHYEQLDNSNPNSKNNGSSDAPAALHLLLITKMSKL